jgi:hypothetical protein
MQHSHKLPPAVSALAVCTAFDAARDTNCTQINFCANILCVLPGTCVAFQTLSPLVVQSGCLRTLAPLDWLVLCKRRTLARAICYEHAETKQVHLGVRHSLSLCWIIQSGWEQSDETHWCTHPCVFVWIIIAECGGQNNVCLLIWKRTPLCTFCAHVLIATKRPEWLWLMQRAL